MNKFEEEGLREMVKINQETGQYDMNEAIKKIQQIEEAHKLAKNSKLRFGPEEKTCDSCYNEDNVAANQGIHHKGVGMTFEEWWETNGINIYPAKELAQEAWEAGYRQGQLDKAIEVGKELIKERKQHDI